MEKVKINDICNISNGYAFKSDKYIAENGARVIRITNVQKGKIVDNDPKLYPFSELDKLDAFKIFEGDILMSLTGNVGRVGRYPKELLPAYINQRVCRVMPINEKLDTNFLFHFLNSDVFENEAIKNSAGAAQLNLSTKWLGDFEILLPPLATQQRIAAILDQADAIIQNNRAIVQKYDALTQSLFLDMFGDPVKNEKGYKIVKLIDVSTKITDGVHAKPEYTESGVPFISVKDITTGSLTFENCKFISNEAHQKYYKRCNPEYDDILYTKVGATYGRPAIVDVKDEFSLYVSVALIKPNRELINPKYLKDALGNPAIKRQADKAIKGIGVPDLHLNMIKEFLLPLPTLEEQNEFESRVIAIEAQKQQAQLELAKSEELFQSLLQRAFNGELS